MLKKEIIMKEKHMLSTRNAFGDEMLALAEDGFDVFGVGSDSSKSMMLGKLEGKYPDRVYDVGIGEQNLIMTSAGLATDGHTVFAASYSVFTSMRALEQFRTFVAYPDLNVKVVAGLGGFTAGIEGVTHIALEDIGIIRCIPNVTLINPSDYFTTRKLVREAAKIHGPVYIRIGRDDSPVFFDENSNYDTTIGKGNIIKDYGDDIVLISTGFVLDIALEAMEILKDMNIKCKLIDIHTIKPLDKELIMENTKNALGIVVIEEHVATGGLGGAVAECLMSSNPIHIEQVCVPDIYTETGLPDELRKKYGLNVDNIIKKVENIVNR
jgi:transketolase